MHDLSSKGSISLGVLGDRVNDLYVFEHRRLQKTFSFCNSVSKLFLVFNNVVKQSYFNYVLWHKRFGHIPIKKLHSLSLIPFSTPVDSIDMCDICSKAKQHKLPFSKSISVTSNPFDLIHIDIWGPYKHSTCDGHTYFLTIVDDHTRYTWVHLLKHKSYAFVLIKAFIALIQTQFSKTIKCIRSDNAYELGSSNEGQEFFKNQGIIHQTSISHLPQQMD